MTDATLITIVTIICASIITIVQYLTKRDVVELKNTVDLQTKQLAMLHQTIASQSVRIYNQEAQKNDLIEKIVETDTGGDYTANPPYKRK